MNLDEAQQKTVTAWIAEGLKLSDIQKRLIAELGLNLTYMEVRLLVDDLKLIPKDIDPPKAPSLPVPPPNPPSAKPSAGAKSSSPLSGETPLRPQAVMVRVDQLARPGTMASGGVTFSDGQSADWYLDQMGRLGLSPQVQGYRPSQPDLLAFQTELQNELAKMGF